MENKFLMHLDDIDFGRASNDTDLSWVERMGHWKLSFSLTNEQQNEWAAIWTDNNCVVGVIRSLAERVRYSMAHCDRFSFLGRLIVSIVHDNNDTQWQQNKSKREKERAKERKKMRLRCTTKAIVNINSSALCFSFVRCVVTCDFSLFGDCHESRIDWVQFYLWSDRRHQWTAIDNPFLCSSLHTMTFELICPILFPFRFIFFQLIYQMHGFCGRWENRFFCSFHWLNISVFDIFESAKLNRSKIFFRKKK